jgi:hypothetical protein
MPCFNSFPLPIGMMSGMTRALLIAATLLPAGALAEWAPLVTTPDTVVHADRANARREGDVVRIKSITDMKRPVTLKEGVVHSVVAVEEYDCGRHWLKVLVLDFRAGSKGGGKVVLSRDEPGEWAPIEKGSLAETKQQVICGWFPGKP